MNANRRSVGSTSYAISVIAPDDGHSPSRTRERVSTARFSSSGSADSAFGMRSSSARSAIVTGTTMASAVATSTSDSYPGRPTLRTMPTPPKTSTSHNVKVRDSVRADLAELAYQRRSSMAKIIAEIVTTYAKGAPLQPPAPDPVNTVKFSVPDDVWAAAQKRAAIEETSLSALVAEKVNQYTAA